MATKRASEVDAYVAKRLRGARLEAGLTQEIVGKELGLTFQQLQKYEKGSNRISAGRLASLARIYRKPIGWFFEGAPGPSLNGRASDVTAEFLSLPYAADLARDYIAIKHNINRQVVATVANALVRNAAP